MWRIAAQTVSCSSSGSSSSESHLRALTPNRSKKGGLPFRQRISTAWISFFARERERTSCSRRFKRRRSILVCSSGTHTGSSSPLHNNRASARASRRSVLARAWRIPVSAGLTTTTFATCGLRISAIAHVLRSPRAPPGLPARGSARTTRASPAWFRSAPPSEPLPPRQSRSSSSKTACPTAFSQKAPVPVCRP